jgi:hypothetical protein
LIRIGALRSIHAVLHDFHPQTSFVRLISGIVWHRGVQPTYDRGAVDGG